MHRRVPAPPARAYVVPALLALVVAGCVGSGHGDAGQSADGAAPDDSGGSDDSGGIDAQIGTDAGADAASDTAPDVGVGDRVVVSLALGGLIGEHTCALFSTGAVECWGSGFTGQLGDGTRTMSRASPAVVSGLTDAVEISAGGDYTCARRADGTVVCWGDNRYGQLGDGTTTLRDLPTPVVGVADAVEIATGRYHTCARRAGGTVVCWGNNDEGAIGDGTRLIPRLTPTPVSALADALEIAAGTSHTCVRRASGTAVACWGNNALGQIGDGTMNRRLAPTLVPALTDAEQISAEQVRTCARLTSGAVECWGLDPSVGPALTPTVLIGADASVEISSGPGHTCARRADGTALCWGSNTHGELGDGTRTPRWTPAPVVGLSGAVEIVAGPEHSCARLTDRSVVCWGSNAFGQLGDGTMTDRLGPTPVMGL